MPGSPEPFCIGSDIWPGLAKLMEECGELVQVCGKVVAFPAVELHPDGSRLCERLEGELGDVLAAVTYVVTRNGLDWEAVNGGMTKKLHRFNSWHNEERARA